MTISNPIALRRVLYLNALFSATSGVVLIAAAAPLGQLFGGVTPWLLRALGAGLLGFAADIALACRRRGLARGKALYFSLADFAWVAGSVALLVLVPLATAARLLVAAVMLVVLAFGLAQWRLIARDRTDQAHAQG